METMSNIFEWLSNADNITLLVAIIGSLGTVIELIRKRQYQNAFYTVVEAVGFKKGEHETVKDAVKEKAKEKGVALVAVKVAELKRRNKTARGLFKVLSYAKDVIF